jgi:hypothetical protein
MIQYRCCVFLNNGTKLESPAGARQRDAVKREKTGVKFVFVNNQSYPTSYKLQAASLKLQASSCKLQAASHKLQACFFVLELDFLFGEINSKLAGFQQAAKLIQNLNGF